MKLKNLNFNESENVQTGLMMACWMMTVCVGLFVVVAVICTCVNIIEEKAIGKHYAVV